MRVRRWAVLKRVLAVLALPLAQGCGGEALPDEGGQQQQRATIQAQQPGGSPEPEEPGFGRDGLDSNAKMRKLNASIPGFGGLFLDTDGRPTIYMKHGSDHARARARLGPVFKSILELYQPQAPQTLDIRILRGDYDFEQLAGWRVQLRKALGFEGVSRLGVDTSKNRVKIGITSESARTKVQELVAIEGIPAEAVHIEQVQPLRSHRTLQDKWWPPPAGMRVSSAGPRGYCTLGYNVYHSVYGWSFITNSHCTLTQGGTEGTRFSQPNDYWAVFDYVGTEVLDPPYHTGGTCEAGRRCRRSDSALIKYDTSKTSGKFGKIAMPYARCSKTTSPSDYCDLSISPYYYNIINDFTDPLLSAVPLGFRLDKIGQRTGQTHGQVVEECFEASDGGADTTFYCQYLVDGFSDSGDSGGPVFVHNNTGDVQAVGLLWGGDTANEIFVFSLLWDIRNELGMFSIR